MRIACVGDGKMGRAVAAVAREQGHEITALLGAASNANGEGISAETLAMPDVVIEFTEPASAVPNVLACVRAGIPVVVGTTGWYAQLPVLVSEVERRDGSMLWAPNFSVGVNLFIAAARRLGAVMRTAPHFDAHIVETHHAAKKDAPSGTAAALAKAVQTSLGRSPAITSVRVGSVPGTHELIFDATFEQLRFTHEARDRRVFADGAVRAAAWLVGRRGVFTMQDVLQLSEEVR